MTVRVDFVSHSFTSQVRDFVSELRNKTMFTFNFISALENFDIFTQLYFHKLLRYLSFRSFRADFISSEIRKSAKRVRTLKLRKENLDTNRKVVLYDCAKRPLLVRAMKSCPVCGVE